MYGCYIYILCIVYVFAISSNFFNTCYLCCFNILTVVHFSWKRRSDPTLLWGHCHRLKNQRQVVIFWEQKHTINFNHFQSLLKLLIVKVTMVAPTLFVFFLWKYHRNLNMFLVDLQGPYILKASKILIWWSPKRWECWWVFSGGELKGSNKNTENGLGEFLCLFTSMKINLAIYWI